MSQNINLSERTTAHWTKKQNNIHDQHISELSLRILHACTFAVEACMCLPLVDYLRSRMLYLKYVEDPL